MLPTLRAFAGLCPARSAAPDAQPEAHGRGSVATGDLPTSPGREVERRGVEGPSGVVGTVHVVMERAWTIESASIDTGKPIRSREPGKLQQPARAVAPRRHSDRRPGRPQRSFADHRSALRPHLDGVGDHAVRRPDRRHAARRGRGRRAPPSLQPQDRRRECEGCARSDPSTAVPARSGGPGLPGSRWAS
jgi:hypothetical protein